MSATPTERTDREAAFRGGRNKSSVKIILNDVTRMLELVQQLMQSSNDNTSAELAETCRTLQTMCDSVQLLIGNDCDGDRLPQLLVIGRPKCGKSSFTNELLGLTVVKSSEGPDISRWQLRRLIFSPQKNRSLSNNDEADEEASLHENSKTSSETKISVIEIFSPSEFLQRCGFEIIDAPASDDLPPLTDWPLGTSTPAVIVYVIDAVTGVDAEVKNDIMQLRRGCPNSQLLFVINKTDATLPKQAGCNEAELETALKNRILETMNRLGVLSSAGNDDSAQRIVANVFWMSCRQLKSNRRRQRSGRGSDGGLSDASIQEMTRLRAEILTCMNRRLDQQLQALLPRLEEASTIFSAQALSAGDLRESAKQAWLTIQELGRRIPTSNQSEPNAASSSTLAGRMRQALKARKPDVAEAVRAMQLAAPPAESPPNWAETQIKRRVRDIQQQLCQKFIDAEMDERLRTTYDAIAKLDNYQSEYFEASIVPQISRRFTVSLQTEEPPPAPPRTITGRRPSRPQQQAWNDPRWRLEIAKKFMRTSDLTLVLKQSAEKLNALVHEAQAGTRTALDQANPMVGGLLSNLKIRRNSFRECSRASLKIWLQLFSSLCESSFRDRFQQQLTCLTLGSQGSLLYAVKRSIPDPEHPPLVVKKIYLDDEELSAMAGALQYSCKSTHEFLLRTELLQLKQLNSRPILWKLKICTERMPPSLRHQLNDICQTVKLSDRLKIGWRIADAVAQMHRDRQPHLNLHLANIFVSPDRQSIRLADHGQARFVRLQLNASRSTVWASAHPPECLPQKGQIRSVDGASIDAFSLGIVLKALVFGAEVPAPFEEANDEVGSLIEDCIQTSPSNRPSPTEVAERLQKILSSNKVSDSRRKSRSSETSYHGSIRLRRP